MIVWYLSVRRLLRDIEEKSRDALVLYEQRGKEASAKVNAYLKSDYEKLKTLWAQQFDDGAPSYLGRHLNFGMDGDYRDILKNDLPEVEKAAEVALLASSKKQVPLGFENLLHPLIKRHCYKHYCDGNFREAVFNSIVAVFDYIRHRTKFNSDGAALIDAVLAPSNPHLILSDLNSESGQNDQKGFMQIYKGAFQGIRNPKAHSLTHDLTEEKAAQYLIFASLLARRIEDAKLQSPEAK
jgi:uncharacterized protein (TIGR02391 family)